MYDFVILGAVTLVLLLPFYMVDRNKSWIVIFLVSFVMFYASLWFWNSETIVHFFHATSLLYFLLPLVIILFLPLWHLYSIASGLMWTCKHRYEIAVVESEIRVVSVKNTASFLISDITNAIHTRSIHAHKSALLEEEVLTLYSADQHKLAKIPGSAKGFQTLVSHLKQQVPVEEKPIFGAPKLFLTR